MNINETFKELANYVRMKEELETVIESLKDDIKKAMEEANTDTITGTEHKATWKAVTSSRIDTAGLKKAYPDIVAEYTKATTAKRFTFN